MASSPSSPDVRIGVLIDADNTSGTHAKAILDELASYGVTTVKRAYGDWTSSHLNSWRDALLKHAIQPSHTVAYTKGKNSTDSALIIDAMDLLYAGNVDAFALVSSDSDFTRLANRLRESGRTVYGIGARKTPASLIAACDKFIFLEVLAGGGAGAGAGTSETDDEDVVPLPDLATIMRAAVDDASQEDGWAHLGAIGNYLTKRHASFDPRNYGFARLITLARAQTYLDVEQADGNVTRVRVKPTTVKKSGAKRTSTREKAAPGR